MPTPAGKVIERVGALGSSVTRGEADLTTVAVSAAALVVLFGGQRLFSKFPWGLLVLLGGLAASAALDLQARGVELVGPVPRGLPTPGIPAVDPADLAGLLTAGAALALVGLAEGLSAARLFAARGAYRIDADQELLASGAANVASGLFGGLGVAGSLSKTAAASDARGRTQLTGLAAAGLAVVVIVAIAPALSVLPRAVLSAIVVNAVWKLMDFNALGPLPPGAPQRHRRRSCRCRGRAGLRPPEWPAAAVAGSVIGLVFRSTRVDVEVMGKVPDEKAAWGSIRNHAERSTYPGVIVLRLDVPLFWVTAAPANDSILALIDSTPGTRALVLDLEATNQMDTTSADALADLRAALLRRMSTSSSSGSCGRSARRCAARD